MKILQLISSGGQYGAESVVLELAASLKRLGCEPIVGVFENQHCPNTEILQSARERSLEGVRIRCAGRFDPKAIAEVRAFVLQRGIDIVNTHGYKANFYGYRAARSCHIPIVATCHNWPGKTVPLLLYSLLDHALLRWFDAIIAVSHPVVRSLTRSAVPGNKIKVIENGIDVDRFTKVSSTIESPNQGTVPRRIGFVGRLAPEKGIPFLLQAMRSLLNDFPWIELILVGDGPARGGLESLARTLKIDENTIFAGRQNDLPKFYSQFDIFALCSLTEGMPMALLEAMAMGIPVVATRVGQIPKIVESGQNGLLIEPADSYSLESALRLLLEDRELRNRLGEAGRSRVLAEFSSARMAKDYLRIYQQLVFRQNDRQPTNAIAKEQV